MAAVSYTNISNKDGFNVIILDVLNSSILEIYKKFLKPKNFKIIQLLPNFIQTKARFLKRGRCMTDQEFENVYNNQVSFGEYDLRIDNTNFRFKNVCYQINKYCYKI